MKRDMQLIRVLMLQAEGDECAKELEIYDNSIILEHKRLLIEHRLAEGKIDETHELCTRTKVSRID